MEKTSGPRPSSCGFSLDQCRAQNHDRTEVYHDGSAREKAKKWKACFIIAGEPKTPGSSQTASNGVEFDAVRLALLYLRERGVSRARFIGDSELIVNSLTKGDKADGSCANLDKQHLIELRDEIRSLSASLTCCWHHVLRENNEAGVELEKEVLADKRQERSTGRPRLNKTSIKSTPSK